MSTFLAQARARSLRVPTVPRPHLTVVPAVARQGRRVPFVALVVGILTAGLVGLLVLNTSLQRGAYIVSDLRAQAADLTLRQQDLQLKVAELQAPEQVAEKALALGMVRNDSPAFLSLATGKVIGVPTPGRPGDQVSLGESVSSVDSTRKAPPWEAGTHNSGSTGIDRVPSTTGANPGGRQQAKPGPGRRL